MHNLRIAFYTYHRALVQYDLKAINDNELARLESNLELTYGPTILLRFTRWSESILKSNQRG